MKEHHYFVLDEAILPQCTGRVYHLDDGVLGTNIRFDAPSNIKVLPVRLHSMRS